MIIVGLGNPGREYEATRHNLGFEVVDELARRAGGVGFKEKFSGLYAKARLGGADVVLLKPQTFMNLSGKCVGPASVFFKHPPAEIVVVHDELDLPFGEVRVKQGGGHGGHNGLRDIIAQMGADFARVRVGIGKAPPGFKGDVADWVLSRFDGDERIGAPDVVKRAADAVVAVVEGGVGPAMNKVNTRKKA